jgi:predicted DNA-binding ribbon-helix-helix protein
VPMAIRRLVNRNLVVERGRTSIGLEPELWTMLADICHRDRTLTVTGSKWG